MADMAPVNVVVGQGLLLASDRTPAERTLVDILRESAIGNPQSSALADENGTLSYRQLLQRVNESAAQLSAAGVRRGDRVGIRIPSGTRTLYISILATLSVGAAYVPVDADDPEERAELVFSEAKVIGVIGADGTLQYRAQSNSSVSSPSASGSSQSHIPPTAVVPVIGSPTGSIPSVGSPTPDDDAWIIFTSGSTGVPKGVAVTHRSAAAFVDAEARVFLQDEPINATDRVLAGLSVAFDASCEEMWLAWRHGACLVPAPRSLVRSGVDLGPWLIAHDITIVSTVPTLAALWPAESLELVRLLIFGGEACPPELAERLAIEGREVWNTYGPTEATVVACAAPLGEAPVRIGLPLDGWDLAVVDAEGRPVAEGEVGELVIGGVGLARYLDPAKDAEKYAPMPSLGWDRAYRSGDLVRFEAAGLIFQGRADDQVKLGGRRIELGEVDAALQALPGVAGAASVVQKTPSGNQVLVGYIALVDGVDFVLNDALEQLRAALPAALIPLVAVVDSLPTRTSGKVDRAALPWPLESTGNDVAVDLGETAAWLAGHWTAILGVPVTGADDDFFAHGGGSLSAAQLVSAIRTRFPETTVADIYDRPRIGALASELDSRAPATSGPVHEVTPTSRSTQLVQTLLGIPLHVLVGLRWLVYVLTANAVLAALGLFPWAPPAPWWLVVVGLLVMITPVGRMAISAGVARLLLRGVKPGTYRRGGSVHLRLWAAEQVAHLVGAANLAGAPWISYYAKALGAKIAAGVDLHSLPPVTGMLQVGEGASVEPEVDLSGYWIDGDRVHIGPIRIGAGATVGSRSTLLPGTRIGKRAEIAPGSAVHGRVPADQAWAGSPAERQGKAKHNWPDTRPAPARRWLLAYGIGSLLLSALPVTALVGGLAILVLVAGDAATIGEAAWRALAALPLATVVAGLLLALLTVAAVRLLGIGLTPGHYPVRSRVGWQVWATERLLDSARSLLFPLYASLATPLWLRALGAKVGTGVEASTVLLLPSMTTIGDHAFLADDTMIASYELGGGWLRIDQSTVGRRAFLGNSGITAPGRSVPRNGLVAVLSSTPRKAKNGSSWLGNPPVRLRRAITEFDESRTFDPPLSRKVWRGIWEAFRLVPVMVSAAIGLGIFFGLEALLLAIGPWWTIVLTGPVLLAAGAVAALVSSAAKWVLVGRISSSDHPLWSSFVWRNEVSDTFVEMVAAPWFARSATGTPALAWWLRSLGAKIGRGVWLETYWLPEADLVTIGDGATVNRGCVVQTHLFHDRVMTLDRVDVEAGGTLGPHSVVLPAAVISRNATVGPASLVMRGERVPDGSRWAGNPIGPWKTGG
ncbi:MAG: Amino acid adenylation protein [Glaciihabitans sp.]|nr:Amino acid adenylation protein [Glaciihabitans sp.]